MSTSNNVHPGSFPNATETRQIFPTPQIVRREKEENQVSRVDSLIPEDRTFATQIDCICPVCSDVLLQPQETPCGHLFCQECLVVCLGMARRCPLCRQPAFAQDCRKAGHISRIISRLRAVCIHKNDGCQWTGLLSDANEHLRLQCEYVSFLCCEQSFSRAAFREHQAQHAREAMQDAAQQVEQYEEQFDMWQIRRAVHHFSYEQNSEAVAILEQLSKKRNAHALTLLAHCYAKGLGTPPDDRMAFELYSLASRQRHPRAMYYLASAYAAGKGCDLNWGAAFDLLLEAARLGDSFAQYSLGMMFELGQSTKVDHNTARLFFHAAAKQGHAAALSKLSKYYNEGIGDVSRLSVGCRTALAQEFSHDSRLRTEMAKSRLHPRTGPQQQGAVRGPDSHPPVSHSNAMSAPGQSVPNNAPPRRAVLDESNHSSSSVTD